MNKSWQTGLRGGRFYINAAGEKMYGKEAEQAARAEGMRGMAGPSRPDAALGKLAAARKGGGLGIPRAEMPQIRSHDVPEFLDKLKDSGIKVESKEQRAGDLKPTQNELNPEKVAAMKGAPSVLDKPIIVSKDGYIMDGHHRWAGVVSDNPDHKMATHTVDLPMKELLERARGFSKSTHQSITEAGRTGSTTPDKINPEFAAKLPKTHSVQEHIDIAQKTIDGHAAGYVAEREKLKSLTAGIPGAIISSRIKGVQSAVEKVGRKPEYGTAASMQDLTAMTVDTKTLGDAKKAIANIRNNYEVISEDDYNAKPKAGYSAHHFTVRGDDGLPKEIQVHTERQAAWKKWSHDFYKPRTPSQIEWATKPRLQIVTKYGEDLGKHFAKLDAGQKSVRPTEPELLTGAPFSKPPHDH